MATAEQHKFFVNFTGGLNTEATPLNFPENSAQVVDNFDLFRTGEIKRRRGLDFENAFTVRPETTLATEINTAALSTHEWKAVNGKGDINFLVVQIGTKLFFHDLGAEPVSGNLRGQLDLGSFTTGPAPENKVFDSDFGEGVMIIANEDMDTLIIEYDSELDLFTATAILMQIRDFDGIEEDQDFDFRPASLTKDHRYNLRNQGWPTSCTANRNQRGSRSVFTNVDPLEDTNRVLNVYPSNADIFHTAKATAAEDAEVVGSFSAFELPKIAVGNTPAPKGHYILDLYSKNRASVLTSNIRGGARRRGRRGGGVNTGSGTLTDPLITTNKRPAVTAFYAGRVWYTGIPDAGFTGDVFFSQSLKDVSVAGRCYQENDPTAEDLNQLLATDGGRIHIADMGRVYWASQVGQDLILASNTGIYAISGSSGANFQADDFTVRKITDEGVIAKDAIIEAEGSLFWWAPGGIWNMTGSQITEELQVNRITRETIQTFYDEIGNGARAYARGFYDSFDKKIYWFYNDTVGYDSINFRFRYNRALVLDLTLGAFYTYTISDLSTDTPWVAAMTQKTPGSESIVTYNIVLGDDNIVLGGDNIVQDVAFETFADVKLKLLTFVQNVDTSYSYTFSEFKNTSFVDWQIWDTFKHLPTDVGENYDSILQSGWNDFGDPIRVKNITHLTSFFNRTETGYELDGNGEVQYSDPSGAFVQTRWEYTDIDVGYWTTLEQAYRLLRQYIPEDENDPFDFGYIVVQTKLRMRGQGHAFSIRYESEDGKDMQLIGFAVNVKAPTKV